MSVLGGLGAWNWVILGAVLIGLEMLVPGTFLLWFGLAALVVGAVAALADIGWQAELILFAVLAVVAFFVGRRVNAGLSGRAGTVPLNQRAAALIGREFMLDAPVVNGIGRVRVDDSIWRIQAPDAPAGARVRVRAVEGSTLIADLLP